MIKSSTCALFTAAAVAAMAFAVGGATMAHAQQSSPAGRSVAAIGKYDYKEHCAVCHDLSGTGDGIFADFLKSGTVVPSLTELSEKNNGVFPFTRVLRNY